MSSELDRVVQHFDDCDRRKSITFTCKQCAEVYPPTEIVRKFAFGDPPSRSMHIYLTGFLGAQGTRLKSRLASTHRARRPRSGR